MNITEIMRGDWDERARKNAFHYIASWQSEWDLDSFLLSGETDFQRLVITILSRCSLPISGRTMIELGCGTGRMSGSFAKRFEHVYALDVSPEMLSRARQIHASQQNISWILGDGSDLSCIQTASMDFVFSYLVLQHLPSDTLVYRYVTEMLRVLRPGGCFLFQFNGRFEPTMNWRGRLAWGIVDTLWAWHMGGVSRRVARLLYLDPATVGKSWRGVAVRADRIASVVRDAQGEVREMSSGNTPLAWCCGIKNSERIPSKI